MQDAARVALQGYLTYKKPHPPRTLPEAYAWVPRGVLEGQAFPHARAALSSSLCGLLVDVTRKTTADHSFGTGRSTCLTENVY